jgi:hypothetical protein
MALLRSEFQQFHPPSILTQLPVMKLDSSLSKKAINRATSSGSPILPNATSVGIWKCGSGPLDGSWLCGGPALCKSAIALANMGVLM